MDKLDRGTLKKKIYTLKKENKKNITHNIVEEIKKKKEENKRTVIKIDTFSNICNGSNPKKIFKIKHLITPELFNIYIFIGSVDPDIKSLIEKINGNFEKMSSTDKNKIIKNFINNEEIFTGKIKEKKLRKKRYIEGIFNTKNDSGGKVEFIYDLINYEDNISLVKKKIFVYLSSKTDFFVPEIQHLWIHTKSKLYSKQIYNIFLTISENKEEIETIEVINKLSIITGKEKKYIEKYLNLEDDKINYDSFLYNKKIITLLLNRVNILGYRYQNKYGNVNINVNPFSSLSNDNHFINSDGSKKDLSAFKDNFKIINEYSEVLDNTICLVSVKDVINYIKSGDYFDGNLEFIYNGFIKKYWPYIEHKKIFNETKFYNEKGSQIYSEIKEHIVKREKSTDMIYKNYPQAQKDISYDNCGLLLTVIHINFPGGEETINIEKIFNNLELSKDIPFIKYKSDNSYETKYKIYKGVAEIQGNGKPYISEKRINSWRKNIVVEKEGKTKITGVPKGLSIKHILYKDEDEYKFCTINILKDAKIEMKLYWTENRGANLLDIKDSVTKCTQLISRINKFNISITNNPYYKIPLPDPNFIMKNKLETNTHIIFMNTSISLTLPPDLELNNIIDIVKCFYSYVSIIDEKQNLKKKILHLRFKRISNYEKMSNIDTFINRKHQELEDIEGKDSLIIQLIKQNFNKTKEEAMKIYVEWTNQVAAQQKIFGGQKFFEIKQDPGTDIKIQKSLSTNIYKIMIEGVKNIDQLRRINNFLRCIIYFYKYDDKKKGKSFCQDFKDIEDHEDSDSESSDEKEEGTLGQLKEKSQIITKQGFEFDSDSEEDSESEEEKMNYDEDSDDKSLSENESSDSEKDVSSEKINTREFQFDKDKLLLRPIREYSLKRLYDADPELFKYETNKKYQAYSTICGEVDFRQPIVISKRNKEIIDTNHPGSYNHYLEYGSKGRKNIYICPKYWCVNCETSLTEEEIYNVKGIYSSNIEKITKRDTIYLKCNIKEIEKIIPHTLQNDKNRVIDNDILLYVKDQKIGNIKITILPEKINFFWGGGTEKIKKDIDVNVGDKIIFKQKSAKPFCPICKGEIIPKSKDLPKKENQSILVRESSYFTPNSKPYPGFLGVHQHPEGLCMPCCFKKWDTHLNKSRRDICLSPGKKVDQDIKLKNERYIKNADKFPLELNKIGMLPKILNNFLGNDINKMVTKGKSGLLNEGVSVFLRKGIEQSQNNSFLRAISHIHNPMWNHRTEDEFIEKKIIKNLHPELFSKLNNGNLVIIFKDNFNLNERNLENFVNWCLNNRIFIEKNQLQEILDIQLTIEDIDEWVINKKQILFRIHNIYTAIINFESYLLSNSVKNEEYLWDLITKEDVIFTKGINLIIFSRNNNEDIEDIHIMCPQGLNPSLVFDKNKKTAFIIKMGKYYEPIERIAFKSGKADIINTFTFSTNEENRIIRNILINIDKIFIENCNTLSNEKYMNYKEENNINFEQYDAIDTYNKIKNITIKDFVVIFQIVDYYNKVRALILKKGTDKNDNEPTFIPVKPSSIISEVPILTDIVSFKFKNLISTYISLNGVHNILSTSEERRINCKPIKLIKKNNLITGIQTINSSIIPIYPNENLNDKKYNELTTLLESLEDNKKDIEEFLKINPEFITLFESKWNPVEKILSSINKKSILFTLKKIINMETVDINIIKDYDQQFTTEEKFLDERIKYMNKMYFENETYERIKFEISKFLQLLSRKPKMYKKIIYDIVDDSITDFETKRDNLKKYIIEIILSIAKISESKDIEKEYNFKLERLRVKCNVNTNQNTCNQKQHCIWEKNILESGENIAKSKKNKFKKIYTQVYEKYSSKLNEDIITQGIFSANKNINEIRNNKIKKYDSKHIDNDSTIIESLILKEIDNILNNYIDKSYEERIRKENEITGGKCKLYINERNLIDNKINIEKYSSLIVEEILRNKIKRREILEGLFNDTIENIDIKENKNEIILSDEDLNSGKLKKIYEKKFDLFIKNKDVVNYEIVTENNINPLPIKIQKKLKYNFKINRNNKQPNNLLECFTIIANKLPIPYLKQIISKEYLYPGKFNSNIIRNIFIDKVIKYKLGNIKSKEDIPFWKHLIDSYTMDNSKNIKEISSFKIFEDYIKENNHWYNEEDISVLHNIFKINIITLNKKNKSNDIFNINYNVQYNYYVLLYCTRIENTNKIKYEIISLNEKYIFYLEDFSEEFQEFIISLINVDQEILLKKPKQKAKLLGEKVIINRKKKRI